MGASDDESPSIEDARHAVFGNLEIPRDATPDEEWEQVDGERMLRLTFPAVFDDPDIGTVRLTGHLLENGLIHYSVDIHVTRAMSTDTADQVRAAIVDVMEAADRNNGDG